jgi:hypothetical protein
MVTQIFVKAISGTSTIKRSQVKLAAIKLGVDRVY